MIHKGVLEYKTEMHERQQDFEREAKQNKLKRNPFNAKINEQSLQNATKAKEKRMAGAVDTFGRGTGGDFGMSNMGGGGLMEEEFGGDDIADKLNME